MTSSASPNMPPQQFCVRWNSYQSNLQNAFPKLLTSEHFVDVTLACENEILKCHKVVLSVCSTYFEKLLLQNPCQHPIIFMKDMKFHEVQSLVEFMYKGEVNVSQDDLPSLLRSAEALQIRGLCGSDQLLSQNFLNTQLAKASAAVAEAQQSSSAQQPETKPANSSNKIKKTEENAEHNSNNFNNNHNNSSDDSDSNDALHIVEEEDDEIYCENETEILESEFVEGDAVINTNTGTDEEEKGESSFSAIANVSCQYDGSPGSSIKRIRRTDEELRRAAECITRGQTFQNVSDQFGIPISTIRFYMARKGILPRRKRGRSCSGSAQSSRGSYPSPTSNLSVFPNNGSTSARKSSFNSHSSSTSGSTSPIGPPYHIVHYKLPQLGVSKLK